jgi:hypothetical protein
MSNVLFGCDSDGLSCFAGVSYNVYKFADVQFAITYWNIK